jgi:uridine kinase
MKKICQNCNQTFECNKVKIIECNCYSVKLSDKDKQFIITKFKDCLCNNCLLLISNIKNN